MVAVLGLEIFGEDFEDYPISKEEKENKIRKINEAFLENRNLVEVNNREINWKSFNNLLVEYIRRLSPLSAEVWKDEKFKRSRERRFFRKYIINHDGKRATEISNHLKMNMIEFLIFSKGTNFGYTLENNEFIPQKNAIEFLIRILWAIDIEKSLTNENLRVSYFNHVRGSIAGFSLSVRLSSMQKS